MSPPNTGLLLLFPLNMGIKMRNDQLIDCHSRTVDIWTCHGRPRFQQSRRYQWNHLLFSQQRVVWTIHEPEVYFFFTAGNRQFLICGLSHFSKYAKYDNYAQTRLRIYLPGSSAVGRFSFSVANARSLRWTTIKSSALRKQRARLAGINLYNHQDWDGLDTEHPLKTCQISAESSFPQVLWSTVFTIDWHF